MSRESAEARLHEVEDKATYRLRQAENNARYYTDRAGHVIEHAEDRAARGLHRAEDRAAYGIHRAEDAVASGVHRAEDVVSSGVYRAENAIRRAENEIENAGKRVLAAGERAVDNVDRKVHQVAANYRAANDGHRTPYFQNIGGEYDATFAQPVHIPFRFILTTPSLWRGALFGRGLGSASLAITSVHSKDDNTTANNEQVTGTLRYSTTFGPTSIRTPPVKDLSGDRVVIGFDWNRPIHLDSTVYGCMPMRIQTIDPTIKLTNVLTDAISGNSLGLSTRLSGAEFMHTLQSKGKYGSVSATLQNSARLPSARTVTGSVATTLFRDAVARRTVTAGVQLDSGRYDSKSSAYPTALSAISFKLDYDEPTWTVDTTVKASSYSQGNGGAASYKLSEAQLRVMYAHGLGKYPRWCAGVSAGLVDNTDGSTQADAGFKPHNEPDVDMKEQIGAFVGQLNTPVVSTALYYQLNPANKMKLSVDSNRRVRSSYTYSLSRNIAFVATFQALFPSFNVKSASSVEAAAQQAQTSLGLSVHVSAD